MEDLLLLLVEDMLLLGVLQESLILLSSIHFLELFTLLLERRALPNILVTLHVILSYILYVRSRKVADWLEFSFAKVAGDNGFPPHVNIICFASMPCFLLVHNVFGHWHVFFLLQDHNAAAIQVTTPHFKTSAPTGEKVGAPFAPTVMKTDSIRQQ